MVQTRLKHPSSRSNGGFLNSSVGLLMSNTWHLPNFKESVYEFNYRYWTQPIKNLLVSYDYAGYYGFLDTVLKPYKSLLKILHKIMNRYMQYETEEDRFIEQDFYELANAVLEDGQEYIKTFTNADKIDKIRTALTQPIFDSYKNNLNRLELQAVWNDIEYGSLSGSRLFILTCQEYTEYLDNLIQKRIEIHTHFKQLSEAIQEADVPASIYAG